ncbi:unnamed protein product [Linum tenue]|uniref:Molybdopterin synthase catalytic subunit n=1 Tax=Linum tenue TaxID=586396 RepID=A0AAV0K618_9ROSI|nr:unnamed protein product [Linum tenue]CAI0417451.1 unnamed protein product [Linum tenue]
MHNNEDKNLIEILDENVSVDIARYTNFVSAPQAGAITTFSGTTRDTFDGKTVVELRYEAYVPMAVRQIQSICSSARATWKIHAIAVAHRLGAVPVGETSVFIAVSAVHRGDALDACKFMIDELKATVPIWKKEVYSNGEVWKENSEFMERRSMDPAENAVDAPGAASTRRVCCGTKSKVSNEESTACGMDSE